MKKTILLLILLLLPSAAAAADPLLDQPRWSLEVTGGTFTPSLGNWSRYYGRRDMPEYATSLAYKFSPRVELGVGAGSVRGQGQAYAALHGTLVGNVTYELYPVHVFALVRGVVSEGQWLVPYVGGGWTRMFYQKKVQDQETVRGAADGYHVRGGLQFALDHLDQSASNRMYLDYGVHHTWFLIEAEYTRAVARSTSTDLGGTSYRGGLLFEF